MSNVLIVSGHSDLNDSVANKEILERLSQLLPQAQIDYLDRLYPNYQIDVAAEQAKLEWADIIVLQFPIFWYAMPSLLTRWIETVFIHGFAHGSRGRQLQGKKLVASFTSGAPAELFQRQALGFEIEDLLLPLKGCCKLCGLDFAGFIYTGGVSYQLRVDPQKLTLIKEKAQEHAQRLVELISRLNIQ